MRSAALLAWIALTGCERTVTVVTGGFSNAGGARSAGSSTTASTGETTATTGAASSSSHAGGSESGGMPNGVCANSISAMYGDGLLSPGNGASASTGGGCETDVPGHATDAQCCSCIVCAREKWCAGKLAAFRSHPEAALWTACVFPDTNGQGGCPKDGFAGCVASCSAAHPGVKEAYIALLDCAVCETCAYNCNAYGELGNCTSVPAL